jgi:hypothetical protein
MTQSRQDHDHPTVLNVSLFQPEDPGNNQVTPRQHHAKFRVGLIRVVLLPRVLPTKVPVLLLLPNGSIRRDFFDWSKGGDIRCQKLLGKGPDVQFGMTPVLLKVLVKEAHKAGT